jgi:hypothetical protein
MNCPKCGLTITGSASRCPRCLEVIPKDNQGSTPTNTAPSNPSPHTKPITGTSHEPKIKPASWDTSLTVTQNYLLEIKSIEKVFEGFVQKSKQIDDEISTVQNNIQKKYADKLSQIEHERDMSKSETKKYADKLSQIEHERDRVKSEATAKADKKNKSINADIAKLKTLEQRIPHNLINGYQKKISYQPIEPNFLYLHNLLEDAKKASPRMGCLAWLPIIGWIIYGIVRATQSSQINYSRDMLMDGIESGKTYYNSLIEQNKLELSQEIMRTDKNYSSIIKQNQFELSQAIVKADRNFNSAKAEADSKLPGYMRTIVIEKKSRMTALENEIANFCSNARMQNLINKPMLMLDKLGGNESAWTGEFSAAQDYPSELLLGIISFPIALPKSVTSQLKSIGPLGASTGSLIKIPYTEAMNKPIQLVINYENSQKAEVMSGVQSFIMKLLKFMPLFSFTVTYIDPNDRGSNLGLLQKLSGISYFDVCKKVYASRDDIQKRLKELEAFVDKTSATLAGIDSVYIYNNQSNSPIVYHFIIINDYPEKFERSALESLEVLIKNSQKCGISIIFTTNNGAENLPGEVLKKFRKINYLAGNKEIVYEGSPYPFLFDELTVNCDGFLEKYKNICNEGIKIDNDFASYFPISEKGTPQFDDSTNKMLIPFAVDSRRNLVELELGSPLTAHALLSGTTGSGKSTTLHMLIMSIIMKYHPDDVQLWLVDYKRVEFAEYIENTPPHVKLIGLERSKEFTCSLLDMIDAEFQRRAELFKQAGVSNITEYRSNGGKIPRVILVIDEFHQMTQIIQSEPHYSQILENILSEYRVFGLSCVFSDQAISVGLRGLTDKGKMQIRTRIAMANDSQEIRETLALDSSFYNEDLKGKMLRMSVGDVMFKRMIEDEAGEAQIILDKYKTVLVTKQERTSVIEWIIKNTGTPNEKSLIVDGQHRSSFNKEVIEDFERNNSSIGKQIPLYVGTPASLNPCFCFFLREKIDSNILVIGANDDLRAAVVYWSIYSFKRQNDFKVYIFADNNDELFSQYKEKFLSLNDRNCLVTTDIGEICDVIGDLQNRLQPGNTRTFIIWLGLENIAEEFLFLPEKSNAREIKRAAAVSSKSPGLSAVENLEADLDAMLKEAFGTASIDDIVKTDSEKKPELSLEEGLGGMSGNITPPEKAGYNASSDIQEIIAKGSRYSIFTLVTYSSYKSLRDTKFVKADNFEHKVAFNMTMDESSTFLGRSSHASGLDSITAVYYDGTSIRAFRPYLI